MSACIFCQIIAGESPANVVRRWPDTIAIIPLGQVTPGHLLVIPAEHVDDFVASPAVTGLVMKRAAELAKSLDIYPANLITSAGREATQSVFHLHVHIVPRAAGDGLALPWYSGKSSKKAANSWNS